MENKSCWARVGKGRGLSQKKQAATATASSANRPGTSIHTTDALMEFVLSQPVQKSPLSLRIVATAHKANWLSSRRRCPLLYSTTPGPDSLHK